MPHSTAMLTPPSSDDSLDRKKVSTIPPEWIMDPGNGPPSQPPRSVTIALNAGAHGDADARDRAFFALQHELKAMARKRLGRGNEPHELAPSDVVQDLCLRYLGSAATKEWKSRGHFLAWASAAMRSILVDHARAGMRLRRSAGGRRRNLDDVLEHIASSVGDVSRFNEALERLENREPRLVAVVVHRFLAGCTVEETAANLEMSIRTVERDLHEAKQFLWKLLKDS